MYKIPVKLTKIVFFNSHWVCLFAKIYLADPQSSCCSPWAAAPSWAASVGYPWAAAFRPCTLLYHRLLLYGCTGRSVLCGARGLQEDGLLLHGPLLGCRELLFRTWSSSCLLCGWLLLLHFTLLSLTVFFTFSQIHFPIWLLDPALLCSGAIGVGPIGATPQPSPANTVPQYDDA